MKLKTLILIILAVVLNACGTNKENAKQYFELQTNTSNDKIAVNDTLTFNIENKKNRVITSVAYSLNGQPIQSPLLLNTYRLGEHTLKADIVYDGTNEVSISETITLLSDKTPVIYDYRIVNTYPHDISAFTQGLEFYNGQLYESTGLYKNSKLQILDYKNGSVIKAINLNDSFFGEGLTVLNDTLYLLTWREGLGFIYNAENLSKTGEFKYGDSKEGWGLTNDGAFLFKSDGTEKIWRLATTTLVEKDFIEVYTNNGKVSGLNELEWIDGQIFANRYQKNGVAIINPNNGAVTGVIDFSSLKNKVTQHSELDVLNGIAYNPDTKTIFVTGKKWDKLFEVEIFEKK